MKSNLLIKEIDERVVELRVLTKVNLVAARCIAAHPGRSGVPQW
jgi:hypothetical protein